jgi:hypothetical protein
VIKRAAKARIANQGRTRNETPTTAPKPIALSSFLLAASAGSATGALYVSTIMNGGHGKYRDLVWPVIGLVTLAASCAVIAANILARAQDMPAKLRTALFCLVGSGFAAGGVFYGVLANCRLSQNAEVIGEKPSPDGSLLAVHLRTRCRALVGYCPSFSQVRITQPGQDPKKGSASVFEFYEEDDYLQLDWRSNKTLRIIYSGDDKRMYRRGRFDNVDIQYLPVGRL